MTYSNSLHHSVPPQTRQIPNRTVQIPRIIAAMSVQIAHQEPATTPPASFTQQPLTPPHSDQTPGTVVEDILHEIDKRKGGLAALRSPWLRYILAVSPYNHLHDLIKATIYFIVVSTSHCRPCSDSTTFLRSNFLSFGCHLLYTK